MGFNDYTEHKLVVEGEGQETAGLGAKEGLGGAPGAKAAGKEAEVVSPAYPATACQSGMMPPAALPPHCAVVPIQPCARLFSPHCPRCIAGARWMCGARPKCGSARMQTSGSSAPSRQLTKCSRWGLWRERAGECGGLGGFQPAGSTAAGGRRHGSSLAHHCLASCVDCLMC